MMKFMTILNEDKDKVNDKRLRIEKCSVIGPMK